MSTTVSVRETMVEHGGFIFMGPANNNVVKGGLQPNGLSVFRTSYWSGMVNPPADSDPNKFINTSYSITNVAGGNSLTVTGIDFTNAPQNKVNWVLFFRPAVNGVVRIPNANQTVSLQITNSTNLPDGSIDYQYNLVATNIRYSSEVPTEFSATVNVLVNGSAVSSYTSSLSSYKYFADPGEIVGTFTRNSNQSLSLAMGSYYFTMELEDQFNGT